MNLRGVNRAAAAPRARTVFESCGRAQDQEGADEHTFTKNESPQSE